MSLVRVQPGEPTFWQPQQNSPAKPWRRHESASWRGGKTVSSAHDRRSGRQEAKTQNSMRVPSSTTRFGGMLKKSVAALALRAMKLNRRLRHHHIGTGTVEKTHALTR